MHRSAHLYYWRKWIFMILINCCNNNIGAHWCAECLFYILFFSFDITASNFVGDCGTGFLVSKRFSMVVVWGCTWDALQKTQSLCFSQMIHDFNYYVLYVFGMCGNVWECVCLLVFDVYCMFECVFHAKIKNMYPS